MIRRTVAAIVLTPLAAAAQDSEIVHSAAPVQIECSDAAICGAQSNGEYQPLAQYIGQEIALGWAWLGDLGFPLDRSTLENGTDDGTRKMRLQANTVATEPGCVGESTGRPLLGCHVSSLSSEKTRIILPLESATHLQSEPGTLVHEFVHSLQSSRAAPRLEWLREAVPEAIGQAFNIHRGKPVGIHPPEYELAFDKPFYLAAPSGYPHWPYFHFVGEELGSPHKVSYLTNEVLLRPNASELLSDGDASDGMKALYAPSVVGEALFPEIFPEYIAKFNNITETEGADEGYYFAKINRETMDIPSTAETKSDVFDGTVKEYAAFALAMKLKVTPEPEALPEDTLMLARIKLDASDANLSLVVEHEAITDANEFYAVIDGSAAPGEAKDWAFIRVTNAPQDYVSAVGAGAEFFLELQTRPIALSAPACAQAGAPFVFVAENFDGDEADNWRLTTDNGTSEGLTVTPASTGSMTVTLEIDSVVTRGESGIARVEPDQTKIELGTYDVQDEDCMVRITAEGTTVTYSVSGGYTEFRAPTGEAVYISDDAVMVFDGQWRKLPQEMEQMILTRIRQSSAAMQTLYEGAHDGEGNIMPRLPWVFSKRLAWSRIRLLKDAEGNPVKRKKIDCPVAAGVCQSTTFHNKGHDVPVVHHANGSPAKVTMEGTDIVFEYGTFEIRRPPGW